MKPLHASLCAAALLACALVVFVQNAWLVDDAYITFRTVHNLFQGHGLTWNPGERVQVYSHPLWMGVLVVAFALSGSLHASLYGASLLAFITALVVPLRSFWRHHKSTFLWRACLFALFILSTKSIVDYSSSGLENVLGYVLIGLFSIRFLFPDDAHRPSQLTTLWALASLVYLNRSDSVLLVAVPLLAATYTAWKDHRWRALPSVALGLSPAALWTFFSLWYYGIPFPNTAYAKALKAGLPLSEKLLRGSEYLALSIQWNTFAVAMLVVGAVLCALHKDRRGLWIFASIALYLLFTLVGGASATHMGGRFLALPLFVGLLLLVHTLKHTRVALVLGVLCIIATLSSPHAPWKTGTRWNHIASPSAPNHIDTQYLVIKNEHATLRDVLQNDPPTAHGWFQDGLRVGKGKHTVHVGGALGWDAVGYFGFAAGPDKHIIDTVALTDPLLSKLPTCVRHQKRTWRSGHLYRLVPEGYPESVRDGVNRIKEPKMHAFYDHVLTMTQGDLSSWSRLGVIARYNLGLYNDLLGPYQHTIDSTYGEPHQDCSPDVRKTHGAVRRRLSEADLNDAKRNLQRLRRRKRVAPKPKVKPSK